MSELNSLRNIKARSCSTGKTNISVYEDPSVALKRNFENLYSLLDYII